MADETRATATTAFKLSPIAASVVAALQPAGPAIAQDDNGPVLDEIIVTATKRSMSLQHLAQSISALTEDDIEKQGLDSLEDIVAAMPSLTLAADLPGRNKIVFRGMNTGSGEYRTDSQASVYLDEIPMTAVSQQLSPRVVDMARIEVLPGPQGTLFGASSQAGTMRYITNKPNSDEFSASVDVSLSTTAGGDDSYDVSGHLNMPVSDSFAMRLVGYSIEEGGWVDNVYGTSLSGLEDNASLVRKDSNVWGIDGGRFSALAKFGDNWSALLTVIAEKSETRGSWDTDPALGDELTTRFHDEFRIDDWVTQGLTITGDLGFAELTSASAWVDRTVTYEWDNHVYDSWKSTLANYCSYPGYDGWPGYNCSLGGLYDIDYIIGNIRNDQTQERFSQELRLTSTGDGRLQWMAGLFYEDVTDEWLWGSITPELGGTPAFQYASYWAYYYSYAGYDNVYPLPDNNRWWLEEYTRNVKQTAVFGEASFDITDAWSVLLGARWFENERSRRERNTFPEDLPPWGSFDADGVDLVSGTTSDTTFKFSTKYSFNDDHMAYVTVSEGFRLGGNNSVRAANTGFVNREYTPDTVTNYEIGNKSTFLDGRIRLNMSIYLMEWEQIQLQRWSDADNLWWMNGTFNGGTAESKGIEVFLKAAVTDNLNLTASINANSAEYTEDILNEDGTIDTPAGSDMPYAPDLKYWVGIDYTIPDVMFGGDILMRFDYSYTADTFDDRTWLDYWDDDNDVDFDPPVVVTGDLLPAWSTSNVTIGWQGESLQISLQVKNVFDEKYLQSFSDGWADDIDEWYPGETRFRGSSVYNRPQEITLRIRKDF
jgi:iron complex outermembrane receptor protein